MTHGHISDLDGAPCQNAVLFPDSGIEQPRFRTIVDDPENLLFPHVPVFRTIEQLVLCETDITAFHTVDLIQDILVYRITGTAVFLSQLADLDVTEPVRFGPVVLKAFSGNSSHNYTF